MRKECKQLSKLRESERGEETNNPNWSIKEGRPNERLKVLQYPGG